MDSLGKISARICHLASRLGQHLLTQIWQRQILLQALSCCIGLVAVEVALSGDEIALQSPINGASRPQYSQYFIPDEKITLCGIATNWSTIEYR
jgi:hypothetical protein